MRSSGFIPITLCLFLVACEKAPTAPDVALARGEVPMKGTYEGTGLFTAPPAECGGFYSVFNGLGRESHTGRYTLELATCTVPVDAINSSFTGEFTKTTANGDLLFGVYDGATELTQAPGADSPIGVFAISGTITFTGGTGRFEGAGGTQSMTGTQWTDFSRPGFPSRMILEFDGTISSVGSLR
jgi:hypothetical protein